MHCYATGYPRFRLTVLAALLVVMVSASTLIASELSVIAPLATRSLLLDVQRIGDTLIAVGERGHILISENDGNSWRQVQTPTRATLTAVFFSDRLNGWAVGHDQVILRTQDGGRNWGLVHEDVAAESPLLDVYFLDAAHGYAIGAYGQFLESFDSGDSWESRWISEDDFHLNRILPVGQHLFIAAEAGRAYRSDDKGQSWTALAPDYEGSFFGLLPLSNNGLLLYGLRGNLFRSDDAGETWMQLDTATEASLTDGLRLNDGGIVIAVHPGSLMISRDN